MTLTRSRTIIILTTAVILLVPLIAMQFTEEVNWTLLDFAVAGALLLSAGFSFELVIRKTGRLWLRIALGAAILIVILLVWAELAVGIFGTPFGGS